MQPPAKDNGDRRPKFSSLFFIRSLIWTLTACLFFSCSGAFSFYFRPLYFYSFCFAFGRKEKLSSAVYLFYSAPNIIFLFLLLQRLSLFWGAGKLLIGGGYIIVPAVYLFFFCDCEFYLWPAIFPPLIFGPLHFRRRQKYKR